MHPSNKHFVLLLPILLVATAATAQRGHPAYTIDGSRVRLGDDPSWSQPGIDDSAWQDGQEWYYSPAADSTFLAWARVHLRIPDSETNRHAQGLSISILASYELYWDGIRIGTNGKVGSSIDEEIPGEIDNVFAIPDSLFVPGEHVVALRISNFHVRNRVRYYFYGFDVGPVDELATARLREALLPLLFLGAFAIIGLYYLFLFILTTRRASLLLFSLLCFNVALLLLAESWRPLLGYSFDLHYVRLVLVSGLTFCTSLLLAWFHVVQFRVSRRRLLISSVAIVLFCAAVLPVGFDVRNLLMLFVSTLVSSAIAVWALVGKQEGSLFSLLGVGSALLILFLTPDIFSDYTFFLAFVVLTVCLLASLSLQAKKLRQDHEKALVNAARLEIELLKKNLHPHFLMNSLTSVMEWIEEDPKTGIRLIEALADELRLLLDVSDKESISVARELELCRSHLATMSLRSDVSFEMRNRIQSYAATVPPAVFLTLVENGITHRRLDIERVVFRLEEDQAAQKRLYTFTTPGGPADTESLDEGVGLRYIRARLQERYGSRWKLESGPSESGWNTTIEVPE